MQSNERLLELVRTELLKFAMPGVKRENIAPKSLLIEELGMDSMSIVHLTLALEVALDLKEFPMQAWVDECVSVNEPLSVRSLVNKCAQVVAAS